MGYFTALEIAAQSVKHLQDNEGNMPFREIVLHTAALDMALKVIAKRNGVTLP